jgi:hypothetical protein
MLQPRQAARGGLNPLTENVALDPATKGWLTGPPTVNDAAGRSEKFTSMDVTDWFAALVSTTEYFPTLACEEISCAR